MEINKKGMFVCFYISYSKHSNYSKQRIHWVNTTSTNYLITCKTAAKKDSGSLFVRVVLVVAKVRPPTFSWTNSLSSTIVVIWFSSPNSINAQSPAPSQSCRSNSRPNQGERFGGGAEITVLLQLLSLGGNKNKETRGWGRWVSIENLRQTHYS